MASGDNFTRAIFGDSDSENDFEGFDTVTQRDSESLSTISSVHTSDMSDFSSESEPKFRIVPLRQLGLGVILRRPMTRFG